MRSGGKIESGGGGGGSFGSGEAAKLEVLSLCVCVWFFSPTLSACQMERDVLGGGA